MVQSPKQIPVAIQFHRRLLIIGVFSVLCGCVSQHTPPPEIQVETLVSTSQSWDGSALPDYPRERPLLSVLRIRIAPGAVLPLHQHPMINVGYLVHGELTVTTDEGKTLVLKAGESIVEVVEKWHSGKNTGNEIAEIVVFYAGAQGMPLSIKKE